MQTDLPDTLTWSPDTHPGITRRKAGRGWSYRAPDHTRIEQATERKRIDALAVPPAYEKVWISPRPNGHLQATGYDARTRKQYRYHTDFSAFRSQTKFDDLARFGAALPAIRRKIASGIARDDLSEDFTVAVVLRLMDRPSLRVGTPDYAAENKTFGATTLRGRHVDSDAGRSRLPAQHANHRTQQLCAPKVIALHDSPPPDIPDGPQGLRQAERALLSLL